MELSCYSELGWLASSMVGGLITYFFTRLRDEEKDKKNKRNTLIATCNSVAFEMALQISTLHNLLKNIEHRISLLEKKKKEKLSRDEDVAITQDFPTSKTLKIDIKKMNEVILFSGSNYRGITETLQSIFNSNEKYSAIMNRLEGYTTFKRALPPSNSTVDTIIYFSESNFPIYKEQINEAKIFILQTLLAFKATALDKFKFQINIAMGQEVTLSSGNEPISE